MKILLVEDDRVSAAVLEKQLVKWAHTVETADTAESAWEAFARNRCDILVCAFNLSDSNGPAFCRKIRQSDPVQYVHTLLIDVPDRSRAPERGPSTGIDDYLFKPLDPEAFKAALHLGSRIVALERELNQKYILIKRNYYQTIDLFVQLMVQYDPELGAHCRRAGELAMQMARNFPGVSPEDYPLIEAAARLHDIGLIGLPRALTTKRRVELNGAEMEMYRSHPGRGEDILSKVDLMRPVARMVRTHHEQYNGRGFPDGLKNEQLPLGSRIVAAASIYDNLLHQEKIAPAQMPEHLQTLRGYQIEPRLVDLLLEVNLCRMQAEAECRDKKVKLPDLAAGMVLSRDLRMKTGAFVMAAGTRLDNEAVARIRTYFERGNIPEVVFIVR